MKATEEQKTKICKYMEAGDVKNLISVLNEVTILDLSNIKVMDMHTSPFSVLAEALAQNETITSIDLSRNRWSYMEGINLAIALAKNKTITSIDLSGSQLGRDGVIAIADALKQNKTLTSINLSNNDMRDVEVTAIAAVLKQNETLTSIGLSNSRINPQGVIKIAEALKQNKTLTSIDLSNNDVFPTTLISNILEYEERNKKATIGRAINCLRQLEEYTSSEGENINSIHINVLREYINQLIDNNQYDHLIYITKCIQNLNVIESIIEKNNSLLPRDVFNAISSLRQGIQLQVTKTTLQSEIKNFITISVNESLEGSKFSEPDKNNLIKTLTEQIHKKATKILTAKGADDLIEQLKNPQIKEECVKALTIQREGFSALIKDKTGLRKILAIIWDIITLNIKDIVKPHKAIENPINNPDNAVVKSVVKPPEIHGM